MPQFNILHKPFVAKLFKMLLVFSSCFLIKNTINAQVSAANYAFTTNATGSLAADMNANVLDMSSGTSTMIGAGVFGGASETREMGFEFWYMGTRCNTYNATSNGVIGLQANNTLVANTATVLAGAGNRIVVFQNGTSAANMMTNTANGKVHTKLFGSEGSYVRVIEWLNMSLNNTSATADATFQLRLYQATGTIEFVYGAMNIGFGGPYTTTNAGFSTTSAILQSVDFNTHTSGGSLVNNSLPNGTIISLNSASNGSRRVYRYTPSTPNAATGINFTLVTANSGTINWTDNSADETGFAIYRSIDAGATYKYFTIAAANAVSFGFSAAQLLPNTSYMWRVHTLREFTASPITGTLTTTGGGTITSAATGNWSDPATWVGNVVPIASDNVIIADGHTVTFDVTNPCANLTVGTGGAGAILQYHGGAAITLTVSGSLTIGANSQLLAPSSGAIVTHALIVGGLNNAHSQGNIINNGFLDLNIGTAGVACNLRGRIDGSLSGAGLTNDFYSITVDKSSAGLSLEAMFDVTIPITMSSPTLAGSRLTITNGTFRLSSASTITPYFGAATICAATSRFWLNHASASVSVVTPGVLASGGIPTFSGEFRIDAGNFAYGSGSQVAAFTGSGCLRMNGGTFTMYGGVSFATQTTIQFVQTAGTITIDPQAGTSLAATSASIQVLSGTTCVLSGGDIVIVDPHSAANGSAVNFVSGAAKAVFGGNLKIGDGVSTTSGGALANNSGFGLSLGFPVYNLIIDNKTNASTSRMARLTGSSIIANSLIVNADAYLFLGTGTTAQTLFLRGTSIANGGTISGNHPTGIVAPIGTLQVQSYSGNSAVTISSSGAGSYLNIPTLSVENYTSNAVSISTVSNLKVNQLTLFTGLLNPTNLSIGNASAITNENPTLQFGGITGSLYQAGTFTVAPTFDETEGVRALNYNLSNAEYTMGSNSEIATGAQTISSLVVNNILGLTIPADRTITIGNAIALSATLNMTLGNINTSGNALTLGISAAVSGTLSYTAGHIIGGTFTRWMPNAALPTTISNGSRGHFPLGSGTYNRHFWMAYSAATITTGGTVSVTHNTTAGTTTMAPSISDGGTIVDTRTNANWVVTQSGLDLGATSITTRIQGSSVATVTAFANLRQIRDMDAVGTFGAGTGSNTTPQVVRSLLTLTDFTNTFYIGGNTTDISSSYNSITTGAWDDGATWDIGSAPLAASLVNILNTHTVTVNVAAATAGTLNILSGGTLTVSGSTLDVATTLTNAGTFNASGGTINVTGAATTGVINTGTFNVSSGTFNVAVAGSNNRRFTSTLGALNVTGGTLNVFGNLAVNSGAFTQSAGLISIDGNDGVTSVGSAVHLFVINTAGTINASGGTVRIANPPAFTNTRAVYIDGQSNASSFTGTHTFEFNDGVSNFSGTTDGYPIETFSSFRIPIHNVIVNSAAGGSNRFVKNTLSTSNGTYIKGNLTINNGGEFRWVANATGDNTIGGNLINEGTMVSIGQVGFGAPADAPGLYTPSSVQTISGGGTFANLTAAPTAQYTSMVFLNVGGTINFATGLNPTLTSGLTVANGTVTADAFSLNGVAAQAIALTAVTSMINTSDLTLNNAVGATLSGSGRVNVTGALNITAGTLTTAGLLTLKSTATNTARVTNVLGTISGNVVVERYLPANRSWRFLTAPVTLASPTTLTNTWKTMVDIVGPTGTGLSSTKPGYNFLTYNTATDDWTGVSNPDTETLMGSAVSASNKAFGAFIPGPNGTLFNDSAATTLSSTGRLQTGAQAFVTTAAINQYALIGNPYASPLDLDLVYAANSVNINQTLYTWDPRLGNGLGTGAYIAWNWNGSTLEPTPNTTLQTKNLQSGQAFFIQAKTGAQSLTIEEAHKSPTNNNDVFGAGNSLTDRLAINLQKIATTSFATIDGVAASFGSGYSKAVSFSEDAEKLWNNEENISIKRGSFNLIIEKRPYATQADTIFLNITSARINTNYNLNFTPSNWDAGSNAYLIDKVLNTETLISLNGTFNHQFTSQVANVGDRFMVVFRGGTLPNRGFTVGAEKVGTNAVKVNWEVQAETGVKNYELQKSADGVSFVTVNTQDGKNGNLTNVYNYTDNSPVIGMNYYRVKTTQLNDIERYSNIVTINFKNQSSNQVNVFPNPVKGNILTLQLNDLEKGIVKTRLMDMTGKQLEVQQFTYNGGSAAQTITLNKVYASGTYQLQVEVKNFKKVITVIIANN